MRRADRRVTDPQELQRILNASEAMHLGLCDEGQPYVVPLHFGWVMDGDRVRIYFHSALEGRMQGLIAKNPRCALTCTASSQVIPADEACGWTAAVASIMAEGTVRLVEDEQERLAGLNALMQHYGFQGTPVYRPNTLKATRVFCVDVDRLSGKANRR